MKNKLISVIVITMLLQSVGIYGAQRPSQQSWADWVRGYFSAAKKEERKDASLAAGLGVIAGASTTPLLSLGGSIFVGSIVTSILLVIQEHNRSVRKYDEKFATIQKLEELLTFLINDSVLYPTRSSKLHALLKKDEFLAKIEHLVGRNSDLLDVACSNVSKRISNASYSDEQKKFDRDVDKAMADLRKKIGYSFNADQNLVTLQNQITMLENLVGELKTVPEVAGLLSIYYRLQNQINLAIKLQAEKK